MAVHVHAIQDRFASHTWNVNVPGSFSRVMIVPNASCEERACAPPSAKVTGRASTMCSKTGCSCTASQTVVTCSTKAK
eukprot:7077831-Lingulodinium_polyedra.AAC.1